MSSGMSIQRQRYLGRRKRYGAAVTITQLLLLVLLLALWELLTDIGVIDSFIMSSPSRVAATIFRLLADGSLFLHIGVTLLETVLGFVIGVVIGAIIAVVLWWLPFVGRVLDPYLVVLNALPKIALGPILIVWTGAGMKSIVVMAVLVSFVVTAVTVLNGFMTVDPDMLFLMRTLKASRFQTFVRVVLPASIPDMVAALKISVGMSWVGVIVGEYLVSKAGLGYLIVYGGQVFKLDLVMTGVVILCILAGLMYFGVAAIERRVVGELTHGR